MGTIVKRKNKNAEVYTVRVRLKNLPEITATFKELKEAERFIFEKERIFVDNFGIEIEKII